MSDNRYRRQHPEDELTPEEEAHLRGEVLEPEDDPEDDIPAGGLFSPEENTFKKRYGDLRRHSQQREAELKAEIESLKQNVSPQMPKTKEEVQEWVNNFPDLADIMKTIMREEIQNSSPDASKRVAELEAKIAKSEEDAQKAQAMSVLLSLHPDFNEIRGDQKFHDWVKTKSQNIRNSLYRDLDPYAAAESVTLYKVENGLQTKAPKSQDNRSAATSVSRSNVSNPSNGSVKWSESRVNSLSQREYEKFEAEIEEAIQSGKFNYDVTAGAR